MENSISPLFMHVDVSFEIIIIILLPETGTSIEDFCREKLTECCKLVR